MSSSRAPILNFRPQPFPRPSTPSWPKARAGILVLPYLLLHGRHSRADLPRFAAEAEARHPGVAITVGPPVGVSEVVLQVLLDAAQAVS